MIEIIIIVVLAFVTLRISDLFMEILTLLNLFKKTEATVSANVTSVNYACLANNTMQGRSVLNFMRKTSRTNITAMYTQSV
jgi:hypothetical protein